MRTDDRLFPVLAGAMPPGEPLLDEDVVVDENLLRAYTFVAVCEPADPNIGTDDVVLVRLPCRRVDGEVTEVTVGMQPAMAHELVQSLRHILDASGWVPTSGGDAA